VVFSEAAFRLVVVLSRRIGPKIDKQIGNIACTVGGSTNRQLGGRELAE